MDGRPDPSFQICQRHLRRSGTQERVRIIHGFSRDVGDSLPEQIEFAFIDGDHSLAGIETDWHLIAPRMVKGGVICLHDTAIPGDASWREFDSTRFYDRVIAVSKEFETIETDLQHASRSKSLSLQIRGPDKDMSLQTNYDSWHQKHAVEGATDLLLEPWHRTVIKFLPDLNGLDVLEIGCGRGDFSFHLARQYPAARITAVDFSGQAIAIARRRAENDSSAPKFEVADATGMQYPNESFDYVISCECLEHIPEPAKMAREITRVLRREAGFILTTENYFNGMLLAWAQSWLTGRPFNSGSGVQPHENFFLYWRVRRLLKEAGLEITHMESNHLQWLLLPRVSPDRLCTKDFGNALGKRIFRPFGRHFTFVGVKPKAV